jgi:hypothetical protein
MNRVFDYPNLNMTDVKTIARKDTRLSFMLRKDSGFI